MAKPSDAILRASAGKKGFTVDRAEIIGFWRLRRADGELANNPFRDCPDFTIHEVVVFLSEQPDGTNLAPIKKWGDRSRS